MPRIRTGYSFRSAVGKIDDVIARLKVCDYPAAPITDRSSAFGWVKWARLCAQNNMRPVFGVELAVTSSLGTKKPTVDYWTFIAHDDVKFINHLISLATQQFHHEPLLTYEQACSAVGVTKIIGHRANLDEVDLQASHIYMGLSPSTTRGYIAAARQRGLQLIAVCDNKFTTFEDEGFYEIVCGRGASTQTYDQFIQTPEQWAVSVARCGLDGATLRTAQLNADHVMEQSTAALYPAELLAPLRPATLREMCIIGAEALGCDLGDKVYMDRMLRELKLIADKDYEDYFYIVADICLFARARMIVGPARGSSCGSLVCYLLGITTIDPIPYGLIFERFIDVNRDDLPDIDIDFSDQQRPLIFEYLVEKYGAEHVARLGTVAMYQPRSALKEAGAALRVPQWKGDAVAESLIKRSSGDHRALNTLEDTLRSMPSGQELLADHPEMLIAARMEGHPRHAGQHAAGIVVSKYPVIDHIAVDHRTGATMCDKKDAEELNLLKIDALGLTQLSVFEDALEMAHLDRDTLDSIPLDDKKAFAILNDGHFSGIFQFVGASLQSIAKQFTITSFDEIVCVTALGRPGPLASGGAHEWVQRKNGVNPVVYPHKIFEPYLKDTLGIVIYQEQVMEIGRNIGNLSWGDVTSLRKAMSKSLGKEFFDQYGDPWKKGAISRGVDPAEAEKVWDELCAYGAWSFNKAHSVAYGLISYQCCWLKAHYPFPFAAATLTHESDPTRQIQLLREMAAEGYDYLPVDKEYSTDKWTVGERDGRRMLVGPLSAVKGIGPKIVAGILGARARGERMPSRAEKLLQAPVTPIDSLWPIRDAIHRHMPDPAARNIFTPPVTIKSIEIRPQDYSVLVFCTLSRIDLHNENEAVKIARRGHEIKDGPTTSLNLQMIDDTDTIFGKINRWKYKELGKPVVDRGRPGKALYAVKGTVRGGGDFRFIMIKNIRHIGDVDE
ncbi:MAG: DNA polymerase III subunit alpha [Gammaproteobacteria bacterium]